MLVPGIINQGTTIRIPVTFQNDADEDIDPGTVAFHLWSEEGGRVTPYPNGWVYGTNDELQKTSTGDFYVDVTPAYAGRYTYRWETTGDDQNLATEGTFVVRKSPFFDDCGRRDYW